MNQQVVVEIFYSIAGGINRCSRKLLKISDNLKALSMKGFRGDENFSRGLLLRAVQLTQSCSNKRIERPEVRSW